MGRERCAPSAWMDAGPHGSVGVRSALGTWSYGGNWGSFDSDDAKAASPRSLRAGLESSLKAQFMRR